MMCICDLRKTTHEGCSSSSKQAGKHHFKDEQFNSHGKIEDNIFNLECVCNV